MANSKGRPKENSYWLDKNGNEKFCKYCLDCKRNCKQSYRISDIFCPIKLKNK
jgi:hypothetical protein